MHDKILELIKTKEPANISQVAELILSLGEPWGSKFVQSHSLYNLENKMYKYKDFILLKDSDMCLLLTPWVSYAALTFSDFSKWNGWYHYINNSEILFKDEHSKTYGPLFTSGGPRSLLGLLQQLNKTIKLSKRRACPKD